MILDFMYVIKLPDAFPKSVASSKSSTAPVVPYLGMSLPKLLILAM
jgi:hypothetical protein